MTALSDIDEWIVLTIVALVGLASGSFATAVAYRMPRNQQFISGRSYCPHCKHALGFWDLFPVLSWIMLRGKCRYCKTRFGIWYPLAELTLTAMFVIIYLQRGITSEALLLAAMAFCLIIIIIIDFEHYIIPDQINITLFLVAFLYQIITDAPLQHLVTGSLFGLGIGFALRWLMLIWKKKEGLGTGDVKFFATVGLFLDLEAIITFLFLSGVLGIAVAAIWKVLKRGELFPFGPALSMALFICTVVPEFEKWWLSLVADVIYSSGIL